MILAWASPFNADFGIRQSTTNRVFWHCTKSEIGVIWPKLPVWTTRVHLHLQWISLFWSNEYLSPLSYYLITMETLSTFADYMHQLSSAEQSYFSMIHPLSAGGACL